MFRPEEAINIEQEIRNNRLLRKIDDEETIKKLLEASSISRFSNSQPIFQQGEQVDSLFLIPGAESGGVLLRDWLDDISREIDIDRIWSEDFFGEIELLSNLTKLDTKPLRKYKAEAIGNISLIKINAHIVSKAFNENPFLRQNAINRLIERYDSLSEKLSEARLGNLDIRLARLLCDLSAQLGISEGRGFRLQGLNNQEKLAKHLSIDRTMLSRKLNVWQREGLIQSEKGALIIKDSQRLQNIGAMKRRPSQEDHHYFIDEIKKYIQMGENFRARNVSLDLLDYFPNSSQIKYLAALSSARSNAPDDALTLLKSFKYDLAQPLDELKQIIRAGLINPMSVSKNDRGDHFDELEAPDNWEINTLSHEFSSDLEKLYEDIIALHPRALKDSAFLSSDAEVNHDLLGQALSGYKIAFATVQRSYVGINTASLALMCGQEQKAQEYARKTLNLIGEESGSYWDLATRAEALIILGRRDEAEQCFLEAAKADDCTIGGKATTRLQLRRLESSTGLNIENFLQILSQPKVAMFTGHMMLNHEILGAAKHELERITQENIGTLLEDNNFDYGFGALACGADILFAESFLSTGRELHVVLPFPPEDFIKTSILPGETKNLNGPSWEDRFHACLSRATSVTTVQPSKFLKRNLDEIIHLAAVHAMGLALMKADELVSECEMLAITNSDGANNIAGAAMASKVWHEATDKHAFNIPCSWRTSEGDEKSQNTLPLNYDSKPHLFVWICQDGIERPRKSNAIQNQQLLSLLVDHIEGLKLKHTYLEKRELAAMSYGAFITLESVGDTVRFAEQVALLDIPGIKGLRLICDYGIVHLKDGKALESDIRALTASKDIKELPMNHICTTERFATQTRVMEKNFVRVNRIGLVSVDNPLPSLPFYRARSIQPQ